MKPGFHLWMLKLKSSQNSGCIHIHQTSRKNLNKHCLPARKLMTTDFWDRKEVLMVEFMQQGTTITSEMDCGTLKKTAWDHSEQKAWNADTRCFRIQLLELEHCLNISTGNCLTTLLTTPISLRASTTCLPTWRTSSDCSPSTIMSWLKVIKRGWAHRRQTSLTKAYRNLFSDTKRASIPAVTTLRSKLSMYVFFV
jgi:hypothetical protein